MHYASHNTRSFLTRKPVANDVDAPAPLSSLGLKPGTLPAISSGTFIYSIANALKLWHYKKMRDLLCVHRTVLLPVNSEKNRSHQLFLFFFVARKNERAASFTSKSCPLLHVPGGTAVMIT